MVAVLDRVTLEKDHWREIENSTDAEDFSDYLAEVTKGTYPGNYAASARTKLRRLNEAARNKPVPPAEVKPGEE